MEEPQIKEIPAMSVIAMTHHGSYDEIGRVYRSLHTWARGKSVKVLGPGLTVFHSSASEFDPDSADYEVCLPVTGPVQGDAKVAVKQLPAVKVAAVTVKGPYSKMPAHYSEMLAWLDAEEWEISGPPREVYVKGPGAEGKGDPESFVTEIQFPVNV